MLYCILGVAYYLVCFRAFIYVVCLSHGPRMICGAIIGSAKNEI